MNSIIKLICLGILLIAMGCEDQEVPTTDYSIYQISFARPSIGNIAVRDLEGGKIEIDIQLNPVKKGKFPTHLHFGGINTVGELAVKLNDLDGESGRSKTLLNNVELSDGTLLTYDRLLTMDGSIKVHNAESNLKDAVIAYGNIGRNDNFVSGGITVCVGH